jgi:uncharacterized protein YjgD (DUF1641 family)
MNENNYKNQLQEINQKLDFITTQMQRYERRHLELDELKNDLTLVGKDIFDAAVEELEDVAPYFDTDDLVHLIKKLLRNTRNINRILTQMESAEDLYRDLQPLGKQVFDEILATLNELDRKGYFEFIKESIKVVDTIVTSFTLDDVRSLRENITSILLTVKSMTQPDMLSTINNAVGFFKKMDIEVTKDISYFHILKEMKNPEVKRGIIFMLEFIKNMSKTNGKETS